MIKHTPQEIADFFGCYVAQNRNGAWFGFPEKPDRYGDSWRIGTRNGIFYIMEPLLDTPSDHDWTHLYEPNPDNKSDACYADQDDSDNKDNPPGRRDYTAVRAVDVESLSMEVGWYVNDGWEPQGGIACDGTYCYQAMVRGV